MKRLVRIEAGSGADAWTGPVVVRGWLRVRQPWLHPIASLTLIRKWRRVRKAVGSTKGFLSFEYWQRLESMLFGMHVRFASQAELEAFDRDPSHRDISRWAMKSRLVIAMKLETFGLAGGDQLLRLGGFYVAEDPGDIPPDSLL